MNANAPTNEFEVPAGYAEGIGNPLEGEGIRLPFNAPYVWWSNGANISKQTGGAPYFGGWAMSAEDMALAAADNNDVLPLGWTSYDLTNAEGEDYTAFMCRVAYVAILGTRFRWIDGQDGGKGKGQYQVLAYLAYQNQERKMVPFSPVVLTTKGTGGMALREAINKFSTSTAAARRQFANNLPVSAFYAALGTFGQAPAFKTVGIAPRTHQVTPVSLWLPAKVDVEYLRMAFVGKDVADLTSQLHKESMDWLAAWKKADSAQPVKAASAPEDFDFNQEPPVEDDSPF